DLRQTDSTSHYVCVLYSSDYETSSTVGYEFAGNKSSSASLNTLGGMINGDATEDVHQRLRELEANLQGEPYHNNGDSAAHASLGRLQVGSSRTFKILSSLSGSSTNTVTAD